MTENTPTANYECEDITTLNEINLLRCKLETKSQVLKSISKELIVCKKEKDEFRSMVEQLGEKCSLMKRRIEKLSSLKGDDEMNFGSMDDYNQIVLSQNYKKLQDSNKLLNFELNDLRIKLADAESDTRLLRDKIAKLKRQNQSSDHLTDHIVGGGHLASTSKNHLVEQIEKLRSNNRELAKDLKLHLDEKEDLVKSRNSYIQKAERLNERLNGLMKSEQCAGTDSVDTSSRFVDIDSILSENSFLKERLKCLEEDKKFNQEMMAKYKHALDKSSSNKKNFFEPLSAGEKLISSLTHKKPVGHPNSTGYLNQDIISTKQLQSFIASNNLDNLELNEATLANLRKLVLALFESVSDKTAALSLAKTNNKLLGKRINDLEARLKEHENGERTRRVERMNRVERTESDGSRLSESSSTRLSLRDEADESEINDRNEFEKKGMEEKEEEERNDERDVNENVKDLKNENIGKRDSLSRLDDSTGLINLPYNLQRLVELELNKLKDELHSKMKPALLSKGSKESKEQRISVI